VLNALLKRLSIGGFPTLQSLERGCRGAGVHSQLNQQRCCERIGGEFLRGSRVRAVSESDVRHFMRYRERELVFSLKGLNKSFG
jgi:hypothetical protein